ncbi:Cytochrome P450 [Polaromonas sp. CG9_12]|nr:Cytochrome P450 [Polaromonas sp. CG9_12]
MQTDIPDKLVAQPPHLLRHYDELPGPRGIPLLGNALQIEVLRFHQQLEQWCGEYGPLFKLQIGNRKMLVVGDHQVVASLLRDRPDGPTACAARPASKPSVSKWVCRSACSPPMATPGGANAAW